MKQILRRILDVREDAVGTLVILGVVAVGGSLFEFLIGVGIFGAYWMVEWVSQ